MLFIKLVDRGCDKAGMDYILIFNNIQALLKIQDGP